MTKNADSPSDYSTNIHKITLTGDGPLLVQMGCNHQKVGKYM